MNPSNRINNLNIQEVYILFKETESFINYYISNYISKKKNLRNLELSYSKSNSNE